MSRPQPPFSATIHVVDDDFGIRESLRRVLGRAGYAVSTYPGGREFLAAYDGSPGCLIVDLAMPHMRGEALLEEIARRQLNLVILVLTAHATIRSAVRVTQSGALDVLEKPIDNPRLLAKVAEVLEGAQPFFARNALVRDFKARYSALTSREKEVMELMLAGLTSQEIADTLGNSRKTVDIHRARVMQKMGAATLAELVREWSLLG
ncbi:response regulator [Marinobacter sp.]|uniref:response regulator transcription factor n=1 Tax=Marinobacter sp. TaxID=50741 RepID=UPI0019965F04|nr:response regulator [Marinobacter sp.]MBD3658352.1 response regulator transcription factor [Marinobacter sp.]